MSRGTTARLRAGLLWLIVTGCAAAAWVVARPSAAAASAALTGAGTFAELLEPVCAVALLGAVTLLWVSTTVTIAGLLRGHVPLGAHGVVRRLVLAACGVAVAAGAAAPAVASPAAADGGDAALAGLRLPERTVGTARAAAPAVAHRAVPADPGVHVVRPGDSLWSVAEETAPPGADVDARWRAIWAANRDVVGDDPDLILPGQRLRLPARITDTTGGGTAPDQTGDRP